MYISKFNFKSQEETFAFYGRSGGSLNERGMLELDKASVLINLPLLNKISFHLQSKILSSCTADEDGASGTRNRLITLLLLLHFRIEKPSGAYLCYFALCNPVLKSSYLTLEVLKYVCVHYGDQMVFFNLGSS